MNGDWAQRSGFGAPAEFGFVTRFLGPQSSLVRYHVPSAAKTPAAAVDVITTTELAALRDYSDAVWYPSPIPVNYQPANTNVAVPPGAQSLHSDADAATDSTTQNWYALTWIWRIPNAYQRVSVVVSQTVGDAELPDPQPISLSNTLVAPLLWISRQQSDRTGQLSQVTTKRADDIAGLLMKAGDLPRG